MSIVDDEDAVFNQFSEEELDLLLELNIDLIQDEIRENYPKWASDQKVRIISHHRLEQLEIDNPELSSEAWIRAPKNVVFDVEDCQ